MNENIETIDSSQMTVLSDFGYVDEVFDNTEHYKIGVFNENVLIRVRGLNGKESSVFLYERNIHLELVKKLKIFMRENFVYVRRNGKVNVERIEKDKRRSNESKERKTMSRIENDGVKRVVPYAQPKVELQK